MSMKLIYLMLIPPDLIEWPHILYFLKYIFEVELGYRLFGAYQAMTFGLTKYWKNFENLSIWVIFWHLV